MLKYNYSFYIYIPLAYNKGEKMKKLLLLLLLTALATIALASCGHKCTPGEPETWIMDDPTCTSEGSMMEVVRCINCYETLSEELVTIPKKEHEGEVNPNLTETISPTCTKEGSKTETTVCTHCGTVMGKKTTSIPKIDYHYHSEYIDNIYDSTCTYEGEYDLVTYCYQCNEEVSRERMTSPIEDHIGASAVVENEIKSTCTEVGSYDEVVYCRVCDLELSRETKSIPLSDHTALDAAVENKIDSTCTEVGSYDEVVYCGDCGIELERTEKTIALKAHTPSDAVIENETAPSCTEDGSYDEVVYCGDCDAEISRTEKTIPAPGHTVSSGICSVCNETVGNEGLFYTYDQKGKYYIVSGIGSCTDEDIHIPSTYRECPVKYIKHNAFQNCTTIRSITIPDSIIEIGFYAFEGCTSLETITLPFIGKAPDATTNTAFSYIFNTVPESLNTVILTGSESIADSAFSGCTGITSIVIAESVTRIGYNAFKGCTGLVNVTFEGESQLTTIGQGAFEGCTSLISIDIPSGVTNLGNKAFQGCSSLTNITFDSDIQLITIGAYAFSGCKNITDIDLPASLTAIDQYAFSGCSGLTRIDFPSGLTEIGNYAFQNCTNLASINFGDDSTSKKIGDYAFSSCTSITSLTIPYNIYSIGQYAFKDCTEITDLAIEGSSYIGEGAFAECSELVELSLDSGIKTIGNYAFRNCTKIAEIVIPDSVSSIGLGAFDSRLSIESISLPSVNTTKNSHFGYIFGATSYSDNSSKIPKGLKSITVTGSGRIMDYTFYGCSSITDIVISGDISTIGEFAFYGCSSLENITLPFIGYSIGASLHKGHFGYIFGYRSSTSYINNYDYYDNYQSSNTCGTYYKYHVPASLKNVIITGGTQVPEYAFHNCANLESIILSDSITNIGAYAFADCTSITGIDIPDNVQGISKYTFSGCTNLSEIEIPDKTLNIGQYAFANCSSLTTVSFGKDSRLSTIGDYAFYGCDALRSINIPSSVTKVGNYAFYSCNELASVSFGEGSELMSIGEEAFYGCTKILSITIPEKVTSIGNNAFYKCFRLYEVINRSSLNITTGLYTTNGCVGYYSLEVHTGESKIVNENDYLFYCYPTDGIAYLIGYAGDDTDLILPANYNGGRYAIADRAFAYCESITSITLPDNNKLYFIGKEAFRDCSSLQSVSFGNDSELSTISDNAFYGCTSLERVSLGDNSSLMYIGNSAFTNCTSLAEIEIPIHLANIGNYAFSGCTSLDKVYVSDIHDLCYVKFTNYQSNPLCNGAELYLGDTLITDLIIPDTVKKISDYAFYGCTSITSVTVPESITSIGVDAFKYCTNITSLYINDLSHWCTIELSNEFSNPLYYGAGLYLGDTLVTGLEVPGGVRIIGAYAFYKYSQINSVTLSDSVESIGKYAFYGCTSLQNVSLSDSGSLSAIRDYAFYGCTGLTDVVIPNSVTSIGLAAFDNCTSLESITLPFIGATVNGTENAHLGYIFGETDYKKINSALPKALTSVTVTGNVSIPNYAFYECKNITSVSLFAGVTSIGESAFYGCDALSSVDISNSVTSIGKSAFYGCKSITDIVVPDSVIEIGKGAFEECSSLYHITVPFVGYSADSKNAYYFAYIFGASDYYYDYKVPSSLKIVTVTGSTSIGSDAFRGCNYILSVEIPESVTKISDDAFYGCSIVEVINKSSVDVTGYFPDAIEIHSGDSKIVNQDDYLFYNGDEAKYLIGYVGNETSITLPENYDGESYQINRYAFFNQDQITGVVIPDGVTSIGEYAFSYCDNLKFITIPNSVKSIRFAILYYCQKVESISIPFVGDSWDDPEKTHFGYIFGASSHDGDYGNSYYTPTTLHTVSITGGTVIAENAFYGCSGIKKLLITSKTIETMEANSLTGCSSIVNLTLPFVGNTDRADSNAFLGYVFGAKTYSDHQSSYIPSSLKYVTVMRGDTVPEHAFAYCKSISEVTLLSEDLYRISKFAFYKCEGLTLVSFPTSLRYISDHAFSGCSKLKNVTLPDGLSTIGTKAFYNCSSFTSITVPDTVLSIGEAAFQGCNKVRSIKLPFVGNYSSATGYNSHFGYIFGLREKKYAHGSAAAYHYYDSDYFYNYDIPETLKTVVITGNITITYGVFKNCNYITNITLSGRVGVIYYDAFKGCAALTSIVLPQSLNSIGDNAFAGCNKLENVYYEGTEEQWAAISVGSNNSLLTSATVTYNYTPEE